MKDWNELSMKERAAFIKVGVSNGLKSIDDIQKSYREYAGGGYKEQLINWAINNEGALWQDTSEAAKARQWLRDNSPEDLDSLYWVMSDENRAKVDRRFLSNTIKKGLVESAVSKGINDAGEAIYKPIKAVADFLPIVGDVIQGVESGYQAMNKNYREAAVGAGLLLVPNLLEKSAKALKKYRQISKMLDNVPQISLPENNTATLLPEKATSHNYQGTHRLIHSTDYGYFPNKESAAISPSMAVYRGRTPFYYGDITFIGDKSLLNNSVLFPEDALTPTVGTVYGRPDVEGYQTVAERINSTLDKQLLNGEIDSTPTTLKALESIYIDPSNYAEAKYRGILPFDRFKYAVFPSNAPYSQEVEQALQDLAIPYRTYPNKNNIARNEIINEIFENNPNLQFAQGGPLSNTLLKPFSYNPLPAVRFANGGPKRTRNTPVLIRDENLAIEGILPQQLDTMRTTWNYLTSKGVSPRNAAAIMGNMMQESSFNPAIVQKGGDSAIGYFQMHGQRLKDYNNYLKEKNLKNSDLTQLDYMIDVINGNRKDFYIDEYNRVKSVVNSYGDPSKLTGSKLANYNRDKKYFDSIYGKREKSGTLYPISALTEAYNNPETSLNDATDLFTNTIERAGKPEYEKRQSYANSFYRYFYGVPQK